jgi:excisionase family DNA binding protein
MLRPNTENGWGELMLDALADKIAARLMQHRLAEPDGSRSGGPQRLLTIADAARYLGRTKAGINHLIHEGTLPTVRLDRRVFLDRKDLDALIEKTKQTG